MRQKYNDGKYWLTFIPMIYTFGLLAFILISAIIGNFVFYKIYNLALLPLLAYMAIQTAINYVDLINVEEKE